MTDRSPNYRRRQLLIGGGATVIASITGYHAVRRFLEDRFSSPSIELGDVTVRNAHAEPATIEIVIERDGEEIHSSSHEMAGAENGHSPWDRVDPEAWAGTSGEFLVSARIEGDDEWETVAAARDTDGECAEIRFRRELQEADENSSSEPEDRTGPDTVRYDRFNRCL